MSWLDRRIVVEFFDHIWEAGFFVRSLEGGYSQKTLHGIHEQILGRGIRFLVYGLLLVMTLKT